MKRWGYRSVPADWSATAAPLLKLRDLLPTRCVPVQVEIQRGFRPRLAVWRCCCERRLEAIPPSCYKFEMSKIVEQWLLFEYVGRELTPLSKHFKTRKQAEKAREKYPERLRKRIGLGVIRIKK